MNNNEPPDDFGFPDSGVEMPDDDDKLWDDLSARDIDQEISRQNQYSDGRKEDHILNDNNGLPKDWDPFYIPTESDLNHAGTRRLRELKHNLDKANTPAEITQVLEDIIETLHQIQWLPGLVPALVEIGLAIRQPAQKIGRLDIWEEVIYLLFHTIHDQIESHNRRREYFRSIFASLADFKAHSGHKFPTQSALTELAREYGMYESDHRNWLTARVAFLNAVILDYSPEKVEYMADSLIRLARRNHDLTAEMRVYVSKARFYAHVNRYREAFAASQQALVIAIQIEAGGFYSECLSFMTSSALMSFNSDYVENLFDYWLILRPHLMENIYEKGIFYGLRGKYYFDRLKDFHQAADAFEQAYECEKIQQKPIAQATSLLGLGMALTKQGDYERAQEVYQQALNIHHREGNGEMEIWIRHAMGWNAKESGNLAMGINHLVYALERSLDLPMTPKLEGICKGIKEDLDTYRSSLNGG